MIFQSKKFSGLKTNKNTTWVYQVAFTVGGSEADKSLSASLPSGGSAVSGGLLLAALVLALLPGALPASSPRPALRALRQARVVGLDSVPLAGRKRQRLADHLAGLGERLNGAEVLPVLVTAMDLQQLALHVDLGDLDDHLATLTLPVRIDLIPDEAVEVAEEVGTGNHGPRADATFGYPELDVDPGQDEDLRHLRILHVKEDVIVPLHLDETEATLEAVDRADETLAER